MEGLRVAQLLKIAQWEMEKLPTWDIPAIRDLFNRLAERETLKLKQLMPFFYVALAGAPVALPAFDAMSLLGRDMMLRRLQYALEALETQGIALKGKSLKELEKSYHTTYGRVD